MSAAGIVTCIGLALLTLALAVYLLLVVFVLSRVNRSLGSALVRLRAATDHTPALEAVASGIDADVNVITATLQQAAGRPSPRRRPPQSGALS